jgi:hypothetical protein
MNDELNAAPVDELSDTSENVVMAEQANSEHAREMDAVDQTAASEARTTAPSTVPGGDGMDGGYRSRWSEVQTGYVDDPSGSVKNANKLVTELIENVSNVFMEERSHLESEWTPGAGNSNEVSTEDLRVSLTRYRELFDRLMRVKEAGLE